MNERTKGMSQTRLVFTHLRAAIVGGRLLPDAKLKEYLFDLRRDLQ